MADFMNLPSKEVIESQNTILQSIADKLGVTTGALEDAINLANTAGANAEAKAIDVENRFQQLTASQQQDAEVVSARQSTSKNKTFASLDARMEEDENDLKTHKAENVSQGNPHGINAKANKTPPAWITATLQNGWTGSLQYRKNEIGQIEIKFDINAGTTTINTVIATLPLGYTPQASYNVVTAIRSSTGTAHFLFSVLSGGNVNLLGSTGITAGDKVIGSAVIA